MCSRFCKVNFSLRLICCCAAYTTRFNNDLNKLVSFSATLWLLVRVAILCSLLYFRAVYPGLISKGWSFLTAAQFLKKKRKEEEEKEEKASLYYSLHLKVTSRYVSYTSKNEILFHKRREGATCYHWSVYAYLWIDGWDGSSSLTLSTSPYISNPSLSSESLCSPLLRWWPVASRHSWAIIDNAESKLGLTIHFALGTVCQTSLFWY